MIQVTDSNTGISIWVNPSHIIKFYREDIDNYTTIRLSGSDSYVRETPEEIAKLIVDWQSPQYIINGTNEVNVDEIINNR